MEAALRIALQQWPQIALLLVVVLLAVRIDRFFQRVLVFMRVQAKEGRRNRVHHDLLFDHLDIPRESIREAEQKAGVCDQKQDDELLIKRGIL